MAKHKHSPAAFVIPRCTLLYMLTPQQQQNNDVTDIIIDDSPAPMEVEEAPNVHDCKLSARITLH